MPDTKLHVLDDDGQVVEYLYCREVLTNLLQDEDDIDKVTFLPANEKGIDNRIALAKQLWPALEVTRDGPEVQLLNPQRCPLRLHAVIGILRDERCDDVVAGVINLLLLSDYTDRQLNEYTCCDGPSSFLWAVCDCSKGPSRPSHTALGARLMAIRRLHRGLLSGLRFDVYSQKIMLLTLEELGEVRSSLTTCLKCGDNSTIGKCPKSLMMDMKHSLRPSHEIDLPDLGQRLTFTRSNLYWIR